MTTAFIILLPLASAVWAIGNAFIHKAYLYFESAKVSKVLTLEEEDNISDWRFLAHLFWFATMAIIASLFTFVFYNIAEPGREFANGVGAPLYCIFCFWGVFGAVSKWMLNGTPFYLGSNGIDRFFDGIFKLTWLMYAIQAACGVAGVWMLN